MNTDTKSTSERLNRKQRKKSKGSGRKRSRQKGKKSVIVTAVILLLAGVLLLGAGSFNKLVGSILHSQLPELKQHLDYQKTSVDLRGKVTFQQVHLRFSGPGEGLSLRSPELAVSFRLPSLIQALLDKKKTPHFSSVEMKEATLGWDKECELMNRGTIGGALRTLSTGRDFQLLANARFSIETLTLVPPPNWSPVLFKRVSPLRRVSFRIKNDRERESIVFEKLRGELFSGRFEGEASFPLNGSAVVTQVNLYEMELNEAGTLFFPSTVKLFGKLSGELKTHSPFDQLWEIDGEGSFALSDMTLSGTHLQNGEVIRKRAPGFEVISFEEMSIHLPVLNRKRLRWNMSGQGKQLLFTGNGNSTTDGVFRLSIAGVIPPAAASKLPWMSRTGLKQTADGGSEIDLIIAGNLRQQEIVNLNQIIKSGVGHGLKNTGRSLLKKLTFQ